MLAKFLRRWIGSVRLFTFMVTLATGLMVIAADLFFKLRAGQQVYNCIIALAGLAAVFVWKDTERPAGYNAQGRYYGNEKDGEV